ncbi:hypothetical protein BJ508DRAFT_320865 [Ascobolus immersus RN42]|uniref:Uncharacterized protein n=1 Tax=Ascobolus immersus RN42 TaxID=1160509 RepID=A0A3N4IQE4_ASCIM|nr:hypothetical protein BJ508DRAFT_320865 [Ascobolus immersus RN42]
MAPNLSMIPDYKSTPFKKREFFPILEPGKFGEEVEIEQQQNIAAMKSALASYRYAMELLDAEKDLQAADSSIPNSEPIDSVALNEDEATGTGDTATELHETTTKSTVPVKARASLPKMIGEELVKEMVRYQKEIGEENDLSLSAKETFVDTMLADIQSNKFTLSPEVSNYTKDKLMSHYTYAGKAIVLEYKEAGIKKPKPRKRKSEAGASVEETGKAPRTPKGRKTAKK